ncbi:3' terminal RNA ribose 2'-O-methyltransferase Hen1, partial [Streptomyces fradiae]
HRFEWTRAEFRDWARGVAGRHGYAVAFTPVGPEDPEVGPPTQMAVFTAADGPVQEAAPAPAAHRAAPDAAPAEKEEKAA